MSEKDTINRRSFLKRLPAYLATAAGIVAGLSIFRQLLPRTSLSDKLVRIGHTSEFPVGSFTFIPDHNIFLKKEIDSIQVVSAVCTHLGCIIERADKGFECPCHGSSYNDTGKVLKGAAPYNLPWYQVYQSKTGEILVDLGQKVASDVKCSIRQ